MFENPAKGARDYAPHVVVLSSHFLTNLDDVVVAPLINDADYRLSGLELEVEIDGQKLTLVVAELSTL